jgi:uncharacterized membrane protein
LTSSSASTQGAADRLPVAAVRPVAVLGIAVRAVLWAMLVAYAVGLGWLCISKYSAYNVGMLDIGNMAQAIGSVQRGEPLVSTYQMGRMSRLALHVELIYLLIAPFYALWSDPRLLLAIQSTLFTLGALPVYGIAVRHGLHRFAAFCLVVVYLFYPVAVTSVLFDFHGDTLAIPMLLYAIDAFDRRAWRRYALFVALALSCKVYVALPVAMIGMLGWWYWGERRAALWSVGVAVAYGALAFFVVRPLFVTPETPPSQSGLNYIAFYFGNQEQVRASLADRFFHVRVVLGPALLLSIIGFGWFICGLVLVLATAISTGPGPAYAYWFHHYALAIPFILMATITGAERIRGMGVGVPRPWRVWLATGLTLLVALLVVSANRTHVDTPFRLRFWQPSQLQLSDTTYARIARDAVKDRIIAEDIPSMAPVAASPYMAAHLTDRSTLYLTSKLGATYPYTFSQVLRNVDYVLADALFDQHTSAPAGVERPALVDVMTDQSFGLARAEDGLLLFERGLPPERQLRQDITLTPSSVPADLSADRRFGDIDLVEAELTPTTNNRLRARFAWRLRSNTPPAGNYMAVSTIEGVDTYRIVHLPTYVYHPTSRWKHGERVEEEFEVELPNDLAPGTYMLFTGWYNLNLVESRWTDERSALPGASARAVATFEVGGQ